MCGNFSLIKKASDIEKRFGVKISNDSYKPTANARPAQSLPVIYNHSGKSEIHFFIWGLLPSWAKNSKDATKPINIRAETLIQKTTFKNLLQTKRCLVPADGFFEWRLEEGKKKRYLFSLDNRELFSFAGLWNTWKGQNDELINTFAIITTEPNELIAQYHNRMPVILLPEHENKWVDTNVSAEQVILLLKTFNSNEMHVIHEPIPEKKINQFGKLF